MDLEDDQRRFATLDEIKKMTPTGSAIRTNKTQREAKQRFSIIFGLTDNRIGDEKALEAWAKTEDDAIDFDPKGMKDLDQFIKDKVMSKCEIKTLEFLELLERHKKLQKTAESLTDQCERIKTIVDLSDGYYLQSTKRRFFEIKIKLDKNSYFNKEFLINRDCVTSMTMLSANKIKKNAVWRSEEILYLRRWLN